ncbi:hypothetical protein BU24DRAFT_415167 [Aaosphaeria arxii CBS 175.79]|uniref:MARVEL domain-containing protein n=1 Tax=Aaosphaeria arxii CBS 175.79 TaxID=1450172 RepID=A0A6A5X8L7_9PLEO|nr:uncharacterized protein BU24DRAFT_415167 [Aaosphaeria arxii CBS 175.79]KAF2009239.1 hypothetical protein BU24DRAFT_415167 [Aaosphaeria arxii CBS 175.79]
MAVIWGLDLKEMQWRKFGNTYMWKNTDYHMRRTKFIVYQLAMIFCVVSESLGTAALSKYVDQQDYLENNAPGATIHNNNFIGIASYNIFVGIYVATIFGSAFFFDLFWPERQESKSVKLAWRICSVLACLFTLSSALGFTVILATKAAYVTGANARGVEQYLIYVKESPLIYRKNGRGIASVVFLWLGMVATIASTVILWKSLQYIDTFGPKSSHARARDFPEKAKSSESVSVPSAAHGRSEQEHRPAPAVASAQAYEGV